MRINTYPKDSSCVYCRAIGVEMVWVEKLVSYILELCTLQDIERALLVCSLLLV